MGKLCFPSPSRKKNTQQHKITIIFFLWFPSCCVCVCVFVCFIFIHKEALFVFDKLLNYSLIFFYNHLPVSHNLSSKYFKNILILCSFTLCNRISLLLDSKLLDTTKFFPEQFEMCKYIKLPRQIACRLLIIYIFFHDLKSIRLES